MNKLFPLAIMLGVFLLFASPVYAQEGLVSYWEFNECSGNTTSDSVGNNDGILYNFSDDWVDGVYGCALEYSGSYFGTFIDVGNDSSLDFGRVGDEFSIEAWVRPNASASDYMDIILRIDEPIWKGWTLGIFDIVGNATHIDLQMTLMSDDFTERNVTCPVLRGDSIWYHMIGMYNSTSSYLYVDGSFCDSDNTSIGTFNSSANATIGGGDGVNWGVFRGVIDNIRVWNRTLTDDEVFNLYTYNSLTEPEQPFGSATLLMPIIIFIVGVGTLLLVIKSVFDEKIGIETFVKILLIVIIGVLFLSTLNGLL